MVGGGGGNRGDAGAGSGGDGGTTTGQTWYAVGKWSMRKAALVGDLPAGQGSGEGSFAGGVTAGGFGHGWKCDFYFVGLGPDGDILHGVVVVDLGCVLLSSSS